VKKSNQVMSAKKKREHPREYDDFVKSNWNKTLNFTDNSKKISEMWRNRETPSKKEPTESK